MMIPREGGGDLVMFFREGVSGYAGAHKRQPVT
jgi:hypothetical protein